MNWGWKIFILYTSFVLFMLTLVYMCTQQSIDLVTENYYGKELKYSDQYQRMQNSLQKDRKLKIAFDPETKELQIVYPGINEKVDGTVNFFRPDNKKLDFDIPVNAGSENNQKIDCKKMSQGLWRVQITWNAGGSGYYEEKQIFIP